MEKPIEISREMVKEILPIFESKLEQAEDESNRWEAVAIGLRSKIAELRAKLNGSELPLANGEQLRKRLPKGYGEKAIFDLLKSLSPGDGFTMSEIKARTGIKHATVYRSLTDPKRNKGRFISDGGKWKLVVRSGPPPRRVEAH